MRIVSNTEQDEHRSSDLFRGKIKRVLSAVQVVLKYGTRCFNIFVTTSCIPNTKMG